MTDPAQPPESVQPLNTPEDPTDLKARRALDEFDVSMKQLQSMMPQIDYDKTFGHYLQGVKDQPVMRAPGRAESFARAFGSEGGNESVLNQLQQAHQERRQRDQQSLQVEHDILDQKVKQEMEKGNSDQALKALHAKRLLEYQLGAADDERKNKAAMDLEDKKQAGRERLQQMRQTSAMAMAKERIAAAVKAHGGDDKMALKAFDWFMRNNHDAMMSMLNADPVLGSTMSPMQTQSLVSSVNQAMEDYFKQNAPSPAPSGSSGKTTPAPTGQISAARKRANEILAERNKKK